MEVCTDHAKVCHEARTVVEKLVMDTNPKLRYKKSDCWPLRLTMGVQSFTLTLSCCRFPINCIALASRSTVSSSR